jgi:hypothetical protein
MSFRTLNKTEGKSLNPAQKFLEWKSNDKCFSYYDKEKKENVKVELPIKIQFLEEFHTIKGFSDKFQTGIYSNEIKFTSKDELTVRIHGQNQIVAEGLYNDIRLKIIDAGGKYHKSIYCLLNGELVNISLKGSGVSTFSLFANGDKKTKIEGNSGKFESHFIEINEADDLKKGATKYSVPVFSIGKPYTKDELQQAIDAYGQVAEYYSKYTGKQMSDESAVENYDVKDAEEVEAGNDGLEF